jgi:hypothetical protein
MLSRLEEKTRELVLESNLTLKELSKRSGLKIGWLHKFKTQRGNGGYQCTMVEQLYKALSGAELNI